MKHLTIILLSLISGTIHGQEILENGIYLAAEEGSEAWATNQDGERLFVRNRQNIRILDGKLFPQTNANSNFFVTVEVPYDEKIGPSDFVLVIDGTGYAQSGSGSSQKEKSSMSFFIKGEEKAKQVSDHLKAKIYYRRHPGHRMLVQFIPDDHGYQIGQNITVKFRIKNVGDSPFSFHRGGYTRGSTRDNQFSFFSTFRGQQVDDIGSSHHHGGLSLKKVLNPGDSFEEQVNLSSWFAFDKAGSYQVHGYFKMEIQPVTDESQATYWKDFASGDFNIFVK